MFCNRCGEILDDKANYCPACGAAQRISPTQVNRGCNCHNNLQSIRFWDAVVLFFTNYADFSSRSRRSEFWKAYLFVLISANLAGALANQWTGGLGTLLSGLDLLWSLVLFLPLLSVCVRRLHDTGRSGWWLLVSLIPLVGIILLIVWFCQDSVPENRWGPDPKS